MEMSKVSDNDDDREQTTLNRKTHFYISLKLRQAWNQIKLNQKNSEKKRCYETSAGPHIHSLKTVCPKNTIVSCFLSF